MASIPKSPITFIKFMVFEFATQIKLPNLFVKRYEKIIPRLCTLRSHLGKSCEVSIVRNNKGQLFFRKGWDKFVKENVLKEGDICVFDLVDDSTFEVLVFGPTCCLKDVSQEPPIQIPSAFLGEKVSGSKPEPSARKKTECGEAKRRRKQKEPCSPDQNIFECGKAKRGRKQKKPQSPDQNMFEHGNAELGRKRLKESDEKKPVAKQPKSEKQLHSHSVTLTLKDHQKRNVDLPKSFANKAGMKHMNKVEIEYPAEGRKWPIQIWSRKEQAFLTTGWSDFLNDNGLITGDTCVLHTFEGKPNFLTAEIYRTGTTTTKPEPMDYILIID